MKKNIMLTGISIFIASIVFGQITENRRGYIGISVGPAIPIGGFASKDANNNNAGFATTGTVFDVSKRIGFLVNADYSDYTPNFKNVQMTSSVGTHESNSLKQNIQTININAGVAFRLK
ncbi:MAG: hypothetical protein IT249_01470 [Chitinophagaceae bacterium]|nr:hypothetical protein [Chitinophagaceae bacterium]